MTRIVRAELVQELLASHRELIDEAQQTLQDIGGCDHSANVCCCGLIRKIENAVEVALKVEAALTPAVV